MARGELHVQLAVQYADDEKFEKVGRSSRLLYVDALCSAKKLLNDGVFSPVQVHKMMYPESKRSAQKAAAELVDAGLWTWDKDRGVYIIAAWLKRNKSRSQIEQDRRDAEEASLKANHKRWHLDRGERDTKCALCVVRKPAPPSGTGSGGGQRSDSTETETETETENKNFKTTGSQRSPDGPIFASVSADRTDSPTASVATRGLPAEREPLPGRVGANRTGRAAKAPGQGYRLPEDFAITDAMKAWAREHAPLAGIADHEMFMDHWLAQSGQRGRKLDWVATWRNWMRRVQENRSSRNGGSGNGLRPSTTDDRIAQALDLGRRMQAEHDAQVGRKELGA